MSPTPPRPVRYAGLEVHSPADLFEQSVSLLHVVTATRRHHIRPLVPTASRSRHDVINGVRVFKAVGAAVAVSQ